MRDFRVEDFNVQMLETFAQKLDIVTVQQEINLIIRPAAASISFCKAHGCMFVAYGSLLGGLLSDRYLGAPRPVPDADHSKMTDYLGTVRARHSSSNLTFRSTNAACDVLQ